MAFNTRLLLSAGLLLGSVVTAVQTTPTASTLNGTYAGIYSPGYDQDFFLGMPYLEAPVEDRRFHPADSLTSTWNGTQNATAYASSCVGYDTGVDAADMAEDCLYLNVIRPHGVSSTNSSLPVAVFIHGGGFSGGSASQARYNLSFIVERSVEMGEPIIAVSFNYRLSAWGFLYSNEIRDTGATNVGLRDQRYALTWIQENIAGFGGDPSQVTLWGQGAGASSVGFQITAYMGRNDSLARAAILESGNPVPAQGMNGTQYFQPMYDQLAKLTVPESSFATEYGMSLNDTCWVSPDRMACLRTVPFDNMNAAINATNPHGWFPVIDGDIVGQQPSRSLYTSKFLQVPVILGASTYEGAAYIPTTPVETEHDFVDLVSNPQNYGVAPGIGLPRVLADQIVESYSNISSSPATKALLYQGDSTIIANRRQACATWAKSNVTAYCYRFNVPLFGRKYAAPGDELPFVFNNLDGVGYETNPLDSSALTSLAVDMSSTWVSFIANLDPNAWRNSSSAVTPTWPVYDKQDLVFQPNGTSFVEEDTYRATPIHIINGIPSGIAVAYQR